MPLKLFLIILCAITARAWLIFGTPLMPGINGGYYLVQARSIIERGALGIPDMPLIFHIHAALAWALSKLSGLPSEGAILWIVKCFDSCIPPLAAWPIFLLVRRWSKQSDTIPLAAAALACLASPWFMMVGDFEKNSLGLLWLAALLTALHSWFTEANLKQGLAVLTLLTLLGLTHIGVLGATVVLASTVCAAFVYRKGTPSWQTLLPWFFAGAALLTLAASLVLWEYDPSRIHRLITALTDPAKFSADGMQMPVPPGGGMPLIRFAAPLGFALFTIPGLWIAWRRRSDLAPADFAIVIGSCITVLAMTGPWFSMDKAMRFNLIALMPSIPVAGFVLLRIPNQRYRTIATSLLLLIAVGAAVPGLARGGHAVLNEQAIAELKSLSTDISKPERTLIAAAHGTEWWTAWLLRTRISHARALKPEDWTNYDAVYYLEVKAGSQMPMMGPRGTPPPGMRGPMPGPPMMKSAPIPPDAEIVHDGLCLKLARVYAPPNTR